MRKALLTASVAALLATTCLTGCVDFNRSPGKSVIVKTFPKDTNEYRYLELDNGIKVMLIRDADASQSAASMSVSVGSYEDPKDREGLAHFLEHMLFLGTEKYPKHTDYSDYLEKHGGTRNAYTSVELTNYHFAISNEAFEGALDRFAQFFISPLFTNEYVEREINAVHSEYFTRINHDGIRIKEVFENVINPEHPAAKFACGNLTTLADREGSASSLREELIRFYETYYSSDKMNLTLISDRTLDQQETLARAKFSSVPKVEDVPVRNYPELFADGDLPILVEIEPIQEMRSVSLAFKLPNLSEQYLSRPIDFVTGLIGHDAPGGLSERLKNTGWVQELSADKGANYGSAITMLVRMSLTEDGMDHIDEVIASVFDMVRLIKDQGVEAWRFDEMKMISKTGFQFAENSSGGSMKTAINVANNLISIEPENVLSIGAQFGQFKPELVKEVLDSIRPDNMVVSITDPDADPEEITEFFDAEYSVLEIEMERFDAWKASQFDDLKLPVQNHFLPKSLDMMSVESADSPVKLSDSGHVNLWHYPEISNGVPRAYINVAFDRGDEFVPSRSLHEYMYFNLLSKQLARLGYYASRGGMSYNLSADGISFGGYSDNLPSLVDALLKQALNPEFNRDDFELLRTNMLQFLKNQDRIGPLGAANRGLMELLNAEDVPVRTRITMVENVSYEEIFDVSKSLYKNVRMQMLASGNITEKQTRHFASQIHTGLDVSDTEKLFDIGARIVKLEPVDGHDVYTVRVKHQDAAVVRYFQGRSSSPEELAQVTLLGSLIGQPYFDDLRTQRQLGYIVQAGPRSIGPIPGLVFSVQSPTVSSNEVEAATDQFLLNFSDLLKNMKAEDFEKHRDALIRKASVVPVTVSEKISTYWSELRKGRETFDYRLKGLDAYRSVTLRDIQKLYEDIVLNEPRSISVIAPGKKGNVTPTVESAESFREGKSVYKTEKKERS